MATAAVSEPGGLKGYLATHRTLETYPVGAHRWAMLMLTMLATDVSFYEFQFAPLLPLWIPGAPARSDAEGLVQCGGSLENRLAALVQNRRCFAAPTS